MKVEPLDRTTIAVTDLTEAGRQLPIPSPAQPVYYVGLNGGFRYFNGASTAGDHPPEDKAMLRIIARILATQGFLGADEQHPATQIIVCTWGLIGSPGRNLAGAGAAIYFLGGRKLKLVGERDDPDHINVADRFRHSFLSPAQETVYEMSHDDLYVVRIRAYDLKAAEAGRKVPLWDTRLACRSAGNSMVEALPRLIVSGQHAIGRETTEPIVENAARTRQAWVEIGESTVVDYIGIDELEKVRQPPAKDTSPAGASADPTGEEPAR